MCIVLIVVFDDEYAIVSHRERTFEIATTTTITTNYNKNKKIDSIDRCNVRRSIHRLLLCFTSGAGCRCFPFPREHRPSSFLICVARNFLLAYVRACDVYTARSTRESFIKKKNKKGNNTQAHAYR